MATVKNCTDLEQSRKLAEFLSIESADMHYARIEDDYEMRSWTVYLSPIPKICAVYVKNLPCWSLAALLDVLPTGKVLLHDKWNHGYKCICNNIDSPYFNNPVDACVDMILKLHELKRL